MARSISSKELFLSLSSLTTKRTVLFVSPVGAIGNCGLAGGTVAALNHGPVLSELPSERDVDANGLS